MQADWRHNCNSRDVHEGLKVSMKLNRGPQAYSGLVLAVGLLLVVVLLAYLNIWLAFGNVFPYASDLRFAFLLICLVFLAGAISGLTQLSKR
jgi:hypothetical protein